MTDHEPDGPAGSPRGFGLYHRPDTGPRLGLPEIVAITLSVLWLVLIVLGWNSDEEGGVARWLLNLLSIVLPLALIWVAASTLSGLRAVREETARLQAAIDSMRHAQMAQKQASPVVRPAAAPRPAPDLSYQPEPEPEDSFEEPEDTPGVAAEDLVRALNFPDDPDDVEGFRALRNALEDRESARLIRAAQDVLTLLAQEGIFMDDLPADLPHPETWRRFAAGERGTSIEPLSGVADDELAAAIAARMDQDPVFHDAVHHFLRMFDRTLIDFVQEWDDDAVAQLTSTRTARAFMLLGRASGSFD